MKRIRLLDLLLIGSLGIMLVVAFAPRGPLGTRIGHWWELRRVSTLLQDEWDSILELASLNGVEAPGLNHVVEILDYECPYSRLMHEPISQLAQGGAMIGYLHFPLSVHDHAGSAALAAICAEGQDYFPEMHNYLMTTSEWTHGLSWKRTAVAAGVPSISEFMECLGSRGAAQRLAAHMELVGRLGVRSTPTFVVQGEMRYGTQTVDELETMLFW